MLSVALVRSAWLDVFRTDENPEPTLTRANFVAAGVDIGRFSLLWSSEPVDVASVDTIGAGLGQIDLDKSRIDLRCFAFDDFRGVVDIGSCSGSKI